VLGNKTAATLHMVLATSYKPTSVQQETVNFYDLILGHAIFKIWQ
jgi:hypothetical protein